MIRFIDKLSRRHKWLILLLTDIFVIMIAFYGAYALRFGDIFPVDKMISAWKMLPALLVAGGFYAIVLGLPKIKLQAFEIQAVQRIGLCALLLALTGMSLSYLFVLGAPRSVPILLGVLFFLGSVSSRIFGLFLLRKYNNLGKPLVPVAIYGAGAAGVQLASALRQSIGVKPVAFVDDNIVLQKLIVAGLSVYPPSRLEKIVRKKKIKRVLIAIPSISKSRQREIVRQLDSLSCEVQILPSYVEMIEGKNILDSLHPVSPDALLGRDKLDSILPNIANSYKNKSVLVSGAGGSIGAELCRQVMKFLPSKLVLFEQSELALYQVERELKPIAEAENITLVPVLGSVCDKKTVEHVFKEHGIQVILHAAAYKHVPLVEANELAGLYNNVFGTHTMAHAAAKAGVERFVLISTDKAVRPTNVMGASKRIAELVLQDIDQRSPDTIFSMVRFGNVLGSSGSVIPLFHAQIAKGGPITVTDNEVTRFFMAISEAAHLVLISGNMAKGGEVFVLDMGKSVKIIDLARRMIELSGLTLRDENNPDGDIEITTIGLRPGEKLYEELLIGKDTLSTPHPKILRAKEKSLLTKELEQLLKKLHTKIQSNNATDIRILVEKYVEGYTPQK